MGVCNLPKLGARIPRKAMAGWLCLSCVSWWLLPGQWLSLSKVIILESCGGGAGS